MERGKKDEGKKEKKSKVGKGNQLHKYPDVSGDEVSQLVGTSHPVFIVLASRHHDTLSYIPRALPICTLPKKKGGVEKNAWLCRAGSGCQLNPRRALIYPSI